VDATRGLTTQNEVEAATNRALMSRATSTIVVADASKLGRVALAQIAGIEAADRLITNEGADAAQVARLRAAGLEVAAV
jgi:DeoR family transcriptional regulator of aga operon